MTVRELLEAAAACLLEGRLAKAADHLRLSQDEHGLDPTELRLRFLRITRDLKIPDREVVKALAASRRPPEPRFGTGSASDIPAAWRSCVEVGYISPLANVPSILDRGILSHELATSVPHESVADVQVQNRRARVTIDVGNGHLRRLHSYANVYLNPRNAMLRRVMANDVVVMMLRAQELFVAPGARVTSRNASTDSMQSYPLPHGLARLDYERVFSESWTTHGRDTDLMQVMQAELLCLTPFRQP